MNLQQAMQVMLRTHIAALNLGERPNAIELKGPPGGGKSSTTEEYGAALAVAIQEPVGMVTMMLATIASVDVAGFMLPAKRDAGRVGTVFSEPPWYPVHENIVVYMPDGSVFLEGQWPLDRPVPRVCIVFLDEFGQGEDDVKKAAAELLLHGRVRNTRLPIGCRVIAASNRMGDRSGVLRPLAFITNRRLELNIDAHLPTWNNWVSGLRPELRPHHLTISFANKNPDLVFRDTVPPGDAPFCTPRTLVMMDKDLRALRTEEDIKLDRLPMDAIAREVCAGLIGGGESAQYFTHIKYADELPDIHDIERDPLHAKVPPAKDAQMVCAFMLAHNVTSKNGASIITYIGRLNIEMQYIAMQVITDRQETAQMVANNREYTEWLRKNKDTMIAAMV